MDRGREFEDALHRVMERLTEDVRSGRSAADLARTWRHVTDAAMHRIEPWLKAGVVVGHRAQLLEALGIRPEHLHGVELPSLGPVGPAFSRGACDVHHVRGALRAAGRAVPTPPGVPRAATPDLLDRWVMKRLGADDDGHEED